LESWITDKEKGSKRKEKRRVHLGGNQEKKAEKGVEKYISHKSLMGKGRSNFSMDEGKERKFRHWKKSVNQRCDVKKREICFGKRMRKWAFWRGKRKKRRPGREEGKGPTAKEGGGESHGEEDSHREKKG